MKSGTHKLREIGRGLLTEVLKGYEGEQAVKYKEELDRAGDEHAKIIDAEVMETLRTTKCLECDQPAQYTRHTQFAGDHPYCQKHAWLEKDFAQDDSYTYWTRDEKSQD